MASSSSAPFSFDELGHRFIPEALVDTAFAVPYATNTRKFWASGGEITAGGDEELSRGAGIPRWRALASRPASSATSTAFALNVLLAGVAGTLWHRRPPGAVT